MHIVVKKIKYLCLVLYTKMSDHYYIVDRISYNHNQLLLPIIMTWYLNAFLRILKEKSQMNTNFYVME